MPGETPMNRKRGFTILELIIVIAVIAILAAVMIPTFNSIANKAKQSSDIQMVRSLNAALQADSKKHGTMYDALICVEKSGFTLASITNNELPDHVIAWESAKDRFVLINTKTDKCVFPKSEYNGEGSDVITNKYKYFVVYDEVPSREEQSYSIYLSDTARIRDVEVVVGFDAGTNRYVKNLTYNRSDADSAQNVIIRTNDNGTTCEFNGYVNPSNSSKGDIIHHYGNSGNQVISSADDSYHEHGAALAVEVKKGHYAQEKGSIVSVLNASAKEGDVRVELKNGSIQGTVKNTNDQNAVTIVSASNVVTVNIEVKTDGGELTVKLQSQPYYANTHDCDVINTNSKKVLVTGIGETKGKNSVCGDGHDFITIAGSSVKICTRCSAYEYTLAETIDAAGSDFFDIEEKTYTCIWNEDGTTQVIKSHDHSFGDPEWLWNGYESASAKFVCTDEDCNRIETVIVPDTSSYISSEVTTKPTCTESGERTYTANLTHHGVEFSDESPSKEQLAALGHNYVAVNIPSTCLEPGYTTHTCSRCDDSYADSFIVAAGHSGNPCSVCGAQTISLVFPNTDKYLYRVGNQNEVSLDKLYDGYSGDTCFTIDTLCGNADGTISNGKVSFSGTGVVKMSADDSVDLYLEVIDAYNATSAVNATDNNVCLLCDITTGNNSINVSNSYSFYGNGFKITNGEDGRALNTGGLNSGFIQITSGGTLDNVILDCKVFPKAYLYATSGWDYYVTESGNLVETNGEKKYYAYQYSAVAISGDSTISNCYIKGARNNILVNSGNVTIKNTVCDRGSLTNVHIKSSSDYTITLEDVTTIQYLSKDDFGVGNDVEGVGILIGAEEITSNPQLVINGYLNQYNWVCSDDSALIDSSRVAGSIINFALNQNAYKHSYNGKDYVNMGILYFNTASAPIADKRDGHGYVLGSIQITPSVSGQVYSLSKNSGSVELLNSDYKYSPNSNGLYVPVYKVTGLPTTLPSDETHCWNDNGTIKIQFPMGNSFDFNVDEYIRYGRYSGDSENVSIVCEDANISGNTVTFENACSTNIVINVSNATVFDVNGMPVEKTTYSIVVPVEVLTPDRLWKDAEITVDTSTNKTGVKIDSSGDRYFWFDIFDGLKITDYDKGGNPTVVLDGSNSTSKKNFVAKIVSVSPSGDLLGGSANYNTASTVTFTLNDGRTLTLSMQRTGASNSPGGTKAAYLKTDSSKNSLYYVTNSASSSSGVSTNMNNKSFTCSYKIYGYKFVGNSGKQVTNNNVHNLSCGLYDGTYTTPSTGTRPKASFSPSVKYTITFDANGGKCSQMVVYTTSSATSVSLPTPTRSGYSFDGWYTAATGGTKRNDGYSPSANETLYAHWKAPFTISFNANGGTSVSSIKSQSGSQITLPYTTQTSQWLEGWYDGETRVGTSGDSYIMPEKNVTLTAHWSPKYTVKYDMTNGGTCNTNDSIFAGSPITLPTPTPGSQPTFEGWFTAVDGGTKVGNAEEYYTPTGNITLYAHWSTNIPVTFIANGGSCGTNIAMYDAVSPITLPTATRSGYQFNGWYTAASGGIKVGTGGASYTPLEMTTLYAQWTAYNVSFDGNGATNPSALSAGSDGKVTLPSITRTGYTFNGWYSAASGGTKVGAAGASYTPNADITLYAQWTVKSYKITITTSNSTTTVTVNGKTVSSDSSVPYNSVVKIVLSYSQSDSQAFTVKQGSSTVTRYSNEACTSTTTSAAAGTYYFKMPDGDVTINSSSKSCLAPDTLILMADGTEKQVQYVVSGDELLVFNHETGEVETSFVLFNDVEEEQECEVINLDFSNGKRVKVISEHGFFDLNLNKYVYIDAENYADFVGHRFYGIEGVYTLDNAFLTYETMAVYSPVTYSTLNYFTEGMLSMPGGITGLFNIFDYDDDLKYNQASKSEDIATYGLFTAEEMEEIGVTEIMFNAYNGQYLKVALGKGILTEDYLAYLIERYGGFTE